MGKKILVIDDDLMNQRMAAHALRQKSFEVVTAGSGREGLEILQEQEIDLVLLDIEMPEMNGIETFKHIQLDNIEIPVIFLTASGDKKDVMEAIRLGAAGYVRKPFKPEDLVERVAKAVE